MQSLGDHPPAKSLNFSELQQGCSRSEISELFCKGPDSIIGLVRHAIVAAAAQLGLS